MAQKKTATATAVEVMAQIAEAAKTHTDEPRFVRTMQVGQHIRQGDLGVTRISRDELRQLRGRQVARSQLAPGTTKGSRHCAEGQRVTIWERPNATELQGPLVETQERWDLTHPDHANWSIPSGCFMVTYQRDYAMEERRRVMD